MGLHRGRNVIVYGTQSAGTLCDLAVEIEQFRFAVSELIRRRAAVDGLVARPASFSLDDLKRLPVRNQITQVICEEGWSYHHDR